MEIGSITDNNLFIYPRDQTLTSQELKSFVKQNQGSLNSGYTENIKMYKGHYPIQDEPAKPLNKPDNRITINFAKYIVDIFNGFFIGIPPQITSTNDSVNQRLQDFNNSNSFADKLNEIAKQTSIYGRSYLFLYHDENAQTKVAVSSPQSSFIIYDDTVAQEPLYFVRYVVANQQTTTTVYDANNYSVYDDDFKLIDNGTHMFNGVPAVEFIENEERQGAFDSVKSIMNAINSAVSQKANDVEAIADAYLFLKGGDFDDKTLAQLKDQRVFSNSDPDADAKFLERPNGDGTQEHLIDRLEDKLFATSMVTNLNNLDSGASSATSGYAIELRMQAMRGLAANKERKFTNSLRNLYRIWFNEKGNAVPSLIGRVKNAVTHQSNDPVNDLVFKFTRNLPKNISDEANTAQTLEGIVSKETQLSVLSIVNDPKAEIKQMEDEVKDKTLSALNTNPANYDFTQSSKVDSSDDEE